MQETAADLAKIKRYAQLLEEENSRLKEELARAVQTTGQAQPERTDLVAGGAVDNLISLYDRGFHICNLYFGGLRQGDCLFCAAFMQRDKR